DEVACREAAVGEVVKEDFVRYQPRHGNDLPAGALGQYLAEPPEIGDLVGGHGQQPHALNELITSAARRQPAPALKQCPPDGMLGGGVGVPILVDGPVRVCRPRRLTSCGSMLRRLHRTLL